MKAVSEYKFDSTAAPDDKITKEINKLRQLRGGFNINEAIQFKLEEDLKNKNLTDSSYRELKDYFFVGRGKQLLDNAVVWIYRKHFTYKELKQLTKFYQSAAGQKMATDYFPIIMLETLAAGERVKQLATVPPKKA
jgi:uncharacterized protein